MLWCELHNSSGVKGGITNFDPAEYEKDLSWLQVVNQVSSSQVCQTLHKVHRCRSALVLPSFFMTVHNLDMLYMTRGPRLYWHELPGDVQDELVTALRGDGRKQAAQRMLRQKKDGQLVSYDSSGFETASG